MQEGERCTARPPAESAIFYHLYGSTSLLRNTSLYRGADQITIQHRDKL